MKIISHRGNTDGPNPSKENNPTYIDLSIEMGYDVEIDLRFINKKFYLGHDKGEYNVPLSWLSDRKDFLWIHCKNFEILEILSNLKITFNYFWHQDDDFTLTSFGYVWTYPGKPYSNKSIIVMPEWNETLDNTSTIKKLKESGCFGICSDFVKNFN